MVGSSAHDADVEAVAFVPASESVDDIDTIACVKVVNGSFSVDEPDLMRRLANHGGVAQWGRETTKYLWSHRFIHRAPPNAPLCFRFPHDPFVQRRSSSLGARVGRQRARGHDCRALFVDQSIFIQRCDRGICNLGQRSRCSG
jgi:hypothetical protein